MNSGMKCSENSNLFSNLTIVALTQNNHLKKESEKNISLPHI